MRTGQLARLVTLERVSGQSRTATGGVVDTWAALATVYASRRDTLGSERVAQGVEVSTADSVFRIRWRGDVTTAVRLVEGGVTFDITAVAELGRREWLDLTCRRVTV